MPDIRSRYFLPAWSKRNNPSAWVISSDNGKSVVCALWFKKSSLKFNIFKNTNNL
jgi:hypothetical protein